MNSRNFFAGYRTKIDFNESPDQNGNPDERIEQKV